MAVVREVGGALSLADDAAVRARLGAAGIGYERWQPARPVGADASAQDVLAAYAEDVERLKAAGGYVTADVIDVKPDSPGLDAMLARFNREHWHDEDEVRFILEGHGLFHVRGRAGEVLAIEVGPGDLLRVPRGTWHWFDLCADRRIRAIRLFQDPAGWTPHYTESGAERGVEPVCLGPAFVRPEA
jgi:1,2-dihydroxy-3-keto-5-methylthiopentene dioxygenase